MTKRISLSLLLSLLFVMQGLSQQLPADPNVKVGKLPNGLTYYIRHNALPAKQADFYIAQRVGSILEEDSQSGLAHFLEHMAFNGTKNFPGNSLIQWCESVGIKFGANLNAYTAFDETVYNVANVPLVRTGILDSALLILHDWSNFISLEGKDIEDERGVIREEWRTTNSGQMRAFTKAMKNIFAGTQYANRLPIGSIDVINNFSHKEIRDYYKKWYRPDLQGIVIVGDFDVNEMEQKVKTVFADIPAPVNPVKRIYYPVMNNTAPIVDIQSDPEIEGAEMNMFWKQKGAFENDNKNTEAYLKYSLKTQIAAELFNQRMAELSLKPNTPFAQIGSYYDDFIIAKTNKAWILSAKPNKLSNWKKTLITALTESERVRKFGFLESELTRAKDDILTSVEKNYNERDKKTTEDYVSSYVKNFTDGEPFLSEEDKYKIIPRLLSEISLEDINNFASSLTADNNLVFQMNFPKKANFKAPVKNEILQIWNSVRKTAIKPWVDSTPTEPLMSQEPTGGKVTGTEKAPFGYTKWTLSNGASVYFRETNFKKDEINVSGMGFGGTSLIDNKDIATAQVVNEVMQISGIGNFNINDLSKKLSGKYAAASFAINQNTVELKGGSSVKDFETLLQLIYLRATAPRMDKDAFDAWFKNKHTQLQNFYVIPENVFKDSVNNVTSNYNIRAKNMNVNTLQKVDYAKAYEIYKKAFADASNFNWVITGNFNAETMKPLVEKYIGGLPVNKEKVTFRDNNVYPPAGIVKKNFKKQLEIPQTSAFVLYSGKLPYTLGNGILMDFLKQYLSIMYTENIREKEGGTYGVSVSGSTEKYPAERFSFVVSFNMNPDKKNRLLEIVYEEIQKVINGEVKAENINKIREYSLKTIEEYQLKNEWWHGVMQSYLYSGIDNDTKYKETVLSVTPEKLSAFAKEIFSQKNIVEVTMDPLK